MLFYLCFYNVSSVYSMPIGNISSSGKQVRNPEYSQVTVLKHYKPYVVTITNNNSKPILLSSNTEIFFSDGKDEVKSLSRRDIYRKTRKRDMGRYYSFAIPGAIISGAITGFTFFLGAPVAAAIYVGMSLPTDKAVRNNVKISQNLFKNMDLPIRLEPNKSYNILFYVDKNYNLKNIKITNVSFDLKNMYSINIPIINEAKL